MYYNSWMDSLAFMSDLVFINFSNIYKKKAEKIFYSIQ